MLITVRNRSRSRLAIIPQNPFLFSGTIRENVDPLDQYTDLHIYKALEKCKVHSLVYRLGGLGAVLDESGSNLSAGQRQLFCLVRAVLHNAKVFLVHRFIRASNCLRAITTCTNYVPIFVADRLHRRSHCERRPGDG